jgi:Tfp pilus assembly ATPase PilU
MNTLDSHLVQLYLEGLISEEEMLGKSQDPGGLKQLLQGRRPQR